jgi:hypothetical protein
MWLRVLRCSLCLCLSVSVAAQAQSPLLADEKLSPVLPAILLGKPEAARIWVSLDGSVIYLVGAIELGTFNKFMEVVRANPKARTVFLASPGGVVVDGYLISNAVRARRFDTWVEWFCASACTLIFAAGQQRILGKDAKLGFHQTYSEEPETGVAVGTDYRNDDKLAAAIGSGDRFDPILHGDDKTVRALRRANVSEAFIGKVLRTPPESLWFPDIEELLREGMATHRVEDRSRLQLPQPKIARAQLDIELTGRPFWRALEAHAPDLFVTAAQSIFREVNSGMHRAGSESTAKAPIISALDGRIVNASDAVVSRFIAAYARQAIAQRRLGYPACQIPPLSPGLKDPDLGSREAEFELAYIALLEDTEFVAAMSIVEAENYLLKHTKRLRKTSVDFSESGTGPALHCRTNFRVDEALSLLEPKYGIPLVRAMLVTKKGYFR